MQVQIYKNIWSFFCNIIGHKKPPEVRIVTHFSHIFFIKLCREWCFWTFWTFFPQKTTLYFIKQRWGVVPRPIRNKKQHFLLSQKTFPDLSEASTDLHIKKIAWLIRGFDKPFRYLDAIFAFKQKTNTKKSFIFPCLIVLHALLK